MNIKKKFSDADLDRISQAVKSAEEKISGEIVPVIVERSSTYTITVYKAGIIAAALTFMGIIILDRYVLDEASHTLLYDPLFIFLFVVLGGFLGAVIANYSDTIKRLLVAQKYQDLVTRQAAENAFLEEEIFNTRQRTGIMIFVSFFEHEVIVMADTGINKVVDQQQWDVLVSEIISRIRSGKLVEAVVHGIERCGSLLLEKGFKKTDDDINELHDDLRM